MCGSDGLDVLMQTEGRQIHLMASVNQMPMNVDRAKGRAERRVAGQYDRMLRGGEVPDDRPVDASQPIDNGTYLGDRRRLAGRRCRKCPGNRTHQYGARPKRSPLLKKRRRLIRDVKPCHVLRPE